MNYFTLYADFLKNHLTLKKNLKVICDCSNGTTSLVLNELRDIPNLELVLTNDTPDPEFPAHGPNPLIHGALTGLSAEVIRQRADFGVAYDADGDRAFFVDELGELMPSFMVCVLLFKHFKPPYVADEWVYKSLEYIKVFPEKDLIRSKIGTRYIKEKIIEHKANAAGEFSGHYYYSDFFGSDSGIFSMIVMANIVSTLAASLSDFMKSLPEQYIENDDIKLGDKTWKDFEPKVRELAEGHKAKIETIEGITLDMGHIWVNMRPSNTEPLVRLAAGGKNLEEVKEFIKKLKALV
ncbi:hypothetical protein KW782_00120 [Candidatus Parcubacteria bacterium]|nr:hypothetical protein [Candidatus Parcubacteria bacterium]